MKSPKILQSGELKKINDYIYDKSGCFAFLLSNVQWAYSEPESGKEAFEKWSVELYTIYHDFGCEYLKYILSDGNVLDSNLKAKLKESKRHVNNVIKVFRNNFAHGIFDVQSREQMKDIVSRYYVKRNSNQNQQDYFSALTDEDWRGAAKRLRDESDALVKNLYEWADEMADAATILNAREIFGRSSHFKNSISRRVVYGSLDKEFSRNGSPAIVILDQSLNETDLHKNSDCKLQEWRNTIQEQFLNMKLKTSEDIIRKLNEFLYVVHNPMEESSVAVGNRCGFSLDGF